MRTRHRGSTLFPYTTLFRSPKPIVDKIHATVAKIYRTPEMRERLVGLAAEPAISTPRSEEHTSELQSRFDLVCRLLLEKKKVLYASVSGCGWRSRVHQCR